MSLILHGYHYSVYFRIARLALAEKRLAYDRVEVNPFAPEIPADYLALHPFGRVPTWFTTISSSTRPAPYLLRRPAFRRTCPAARRAEALARMDQIIGVADSTATGRWCGRSSHRVFRPGGRPPDGRRWARSGRRSQVLAALEAGRAGRLPRRTVDFARRLSSGAMIAYFAAAPKAWPC
jgi:glutathione S-transferase